jgi:hypothetical protein
MSGSLRIAVAAVSFSRVRTLGRPPRQTYLPDKTGTPKWPLSPGSRSGMFAALNSPGVPVDRRTLVRVWGRVAVSACSAVLFVVTLIWPRWIELAFHADPDRGSGEFEWAIVLISLTVSLSMAFLARREWRRCVALADQA